MYADAKYIADSGNNVSIRVKINGVISYVPIDAANTDYRNIMAKVSAGTMVIAPAD